MELPEEQRTSAEILAINGLWMEQVLATPTRKATDAANSYNSSVIANLRRAYDREHSVPDDALLKFYFDGGAYDVEGIESHQVEDGGMSTDQIMQELIATYKAKHCAE